MKTKHFIKGLLLLLTALLLEACSTLNTSPAKASSDSPETINASLETLAKLFAKAVTNESVRVQIQQGVSEKFDGDTNVLYKTLMASSHSQVIRQSLANSQEGLSSQATLDALATSIPRLQLAMPAHFDSWNAKTYMPLVGYVPAGIDDQALKEIKAFDAEGNLHVLDAQVLPDQPVLLLSQNERSDETGKVLSAFLEQASGTSLQTQSCIKNVYMEKVYLRDDHEPWIKGDPEVKLIAVSRNYDLSYHGGFLSVNDEGTWYSYHRLLGCTSTDVIYYWYEDDGGSLDLTVSYKGFSLQVKIDDSDDFMGAIQVPYGYLNSTPTRWDLGDLVFYSN
jgi:hypothetical protein